MGLKVFLQKLQDKRVMGHRNQVGFTKVFQDLSKDKYYDYLKI
jgi:hypothetical protein